jgi:hypothetical protein
MSLALDLERVRSNEVLERTRLSSPKPLKPPWHYLSGASRLSVTPIEGRFPKLMRRMPPTTQRRNTAYLNRQISRFGQLDRDLHGPSGVTLTGLAFDLGGSLKQRFRPDEIGTAYLDQLLTMIAPLDRRATPGRSHS